MPDPQAHTPPADMPRKRSPHSRLLALVALALVLGFAFQGTRGLWSTDEGRYTENALQMVDSGNYLMPAYSADRPNYSKPPMTAWVIAASVRLFGHNTWAVRAPYALAFALTVLLLYAMGRKLVPDKPWLPGLVYACALFPFLAANIVSTDVLLTLFEALAAMGFVHAHFGPARGSGRGGIGLMWLGFGLAFLTKGPPGLLPLLGMLPFVLQRDGWRGLGRMFAPLGIAIFLLAALPWYVLVVLRTPGLLHYYLHYEVYDRVFTGAQGRHSEWYGWIVIYVPVLGLGTLPWWPALVRGLGAVARPARWRRWWREPSSRLFLLLWFLVPLAVFCLASSRLPLYLLPLFLPLSLLLALVLRSRIDLRRNGQRVALGVWIVLLLAVKGVASHTLHPAADNRRAARELVTATGGMDYDALVIVKNTPQDQAIQEGLPWGMRLYLQRPLYGVAWLGGDRDARICRVLERHPRVLFAVEPKIHAAAVIAALQQCPGRVPHTELGTWRHRHLILASP